MDPLAGRNDAVGFFDASAEDYATTFYGNAVRSFMTVRQHRVLEFVDALNLPPGSRVLDAGCGPGYLLSALAKRGLRPAGMDASRQMLRTAGGRVAEQNGKPRASLVQAGIEQLPYRNESFDLVCSNGVIEYLTEDHATLSEMFRVLRPGGHLLLPVTNAWSPVNWFDFVVESLKRREVIRRTFNSVWERLGHSPVLPRHFRVRRHRPGAFRRALAKAGFRIEDEIYFHFLPWPHPFDRLLPAPSAAIGESMERWGRSWMGPIGEGFLTLSSKPA